MIKLSLATRLENISDFGFQVRFIFSMADYPVTVRKQALKKPSTGDLKRVESSLDYHLCGNLRVVLTTYSCVSLEKIGALDEKL